MSSSSPSTQYVLYLVACGSRPAADLPAFIQYVQQQDWTVCTIATPSALKFIDAAVIQDITGFPVRHDYKQPDAPDVLPAPHAYVVAPATFNTINKWANGISDTLALGLLNEALGLQMPTLAVPFVNSGLARHPAFTRAMQQLRDAGVELLFDPRAHALPAPNQGPTSRYLFPWDALRGRMHALRQAVRSTAW